MSTIREFDPLRDPESLRACFIELQDFEHGLDPRMPRGEDVAEPYLERMLARCECYDGVVLVAEVEGRVAGYVTVWTRYRSGEPDDDPAPHGFVSDLVVLAKHRGQGIGRALLRAAEQRSRAAGASLLRLSVKSGNDAALGLYADEGFEESERQLEKTLR